MTVAIMCWLWLEGAVLLDHHLPMHACRHMLNRPCCYQGWCGARVLGRYIEDGSHPFVVLQVVDVGWGGKLCANDEPVVDFVVIWVEHRRKGLELNSLFD